jgi:hypothetical protein
VIPSASAPKNNCGAFEPAPLLLVVEDVAPDPVAVLPVFVAAEAPVPVVLWKCQK